MSTPTDVTISESAFPSIRILHEIVWCEKKIQSLMPKLLKKPSTQREINDLKRQIADKNAVLEYRQSKRGTK